jgi:hypothetical protein
MTEQKRASIALIFILAGSTFSFVSADKSQTILRVIFVLAGFCFMIPIFVRKYKTSPGKWRTFLAVATLGMIVYLFDAVFQLLGR